MNKYYLFVSETVRKILRHRFHMNPQGNKTNSPFSLENFFFGS